MEEYQARADAITSQNGELIASVQQTCADSLKYVSTMSGESTGAVQKSLTALEALKQRAQEVAAEVARLTEETKSSEAQEAQKLVKAGAVVDEKTLGIAFNTAGNELKVGNYGAEQLAQAERDKVNAAFAASYDEAGGENADPAKLQQLRDTQKARLAEIEAELAADKARIQEAYAQTIRELMAGLASQSPEMQTQLAGAFEKLDLAEALQKALDSGDTSGLTGNQELMDRIGKALGISDPASFLKSFENLGDASGFASALESYIARLTDGAAGEMGGVESTQMATALQGMIDSGLTAALEGYDPESQRDKIALMIGKWNLPQTIRDAAKSPLTLSGPEGGGVPGGGAPEGGAPIPVPVDVKPEVTVQDAPGAIKAAVENSVSGSGESGEGSAPAVSAEVPVSVTPIPVAEENAGGKLAEALISGLNGMLESVKNAGTSLSKAAAIAFMSETGTARSSGIAMVQGLINGAESKRDSLVNKFKSLAKAAIQAARSELGIASPSKVFEEIGAFTAQGFLRGVDKNMYGAQESMRRLTDAGAFAPRSIAGAGTPSGSIINNHHHDAPISITFPGAVVRSDNDIRELERRTQRLARDLQYGLGARS